MDFLELGLTALRGLAVYALMLVVVRVLGKRTVGNFSAFDFLVALMLGEVVDEIIYGDVSFLQGTVAIVVIAAAKYFTAWLSYVSPGMNKILEGTPTELVKHGEFVPQGLHSELMNEKEVLAALRIHGISDLREIRLAVMEIDGEVSVLKEEWAETLQKQDLQKGKKKSGEDEPPLDKRTDTPEALGLEA